LDEKSSHKKYYNGVFRSSTRAAAHNQYQYWLHLNSAI
jgi:hypothetical protein